MKTLRIFLLFLISVSFAGGAPGPGERGTILLKEITSQKWAAGWKSATLENVRLVAQKPDLDEPTGLPPVWSASIVGPGGKKGHLMWDRSGEGRLVEFSLDDKLVIKGESAKAIAGVPSLQEFPIKDAKGELVASGCVPTAAASVVSFWADKAYPQWRGDDGKTPKDIALRLRKKLKITLYPDLDGFSPNRMALAGVSPSDLSKALAEEIATYQIPMALGLGQFTFERLEKEIDASCPALLSCIVRLAHKPELSWPHEVTAIGYCQIDGVRLVGVLDNFYPTKHEETIRWIREDAFRSILILRPVENPGE